MLQVLELTQGRQVETEILAVLVQQMSEARQESGVHGQDTPSETQPGFSLPTCLLFESARALPCSALLCLLLEQSLPCLRESPLPCPALPCLLLMQLLSSHLDGPVPN